MTELKSTREISHENNGTGPSVAIMRFFYIL